MLLAAHMAGIGMATTGLGLCHAIGHAIGGRFDIAHGVTLTAVLPQVLRFSVPACAERLADVAFALGARRRRQGHAWNAAAAIDAVAGWPIGLDVAALADYGITEADFGQIAADALADEVLTNTPRQPTAADIATILAPRSASRRLEGHALPRSSSKVPPMLARGRPGRR